MTRTYIHIVLAAVCGLTAAATNAASVIHLICRGGVSEDTNFRVYSYAAGAGAVYYDFTPYSGKKADVKRDGSHLAPGQCSWATDVLASKYHTMYYEIAPSEQQIDHSSQIRPYLNADNTITFDTFAVIDRDDGDPNQAFIPHINGPKGVPDSVAGSILDPSMIFNFYVTIDPYNKLQLQYVK